MLLVDDDTAYLKFLEHCIKKLGIKCFATNDSSKAIELLSREHPDIVLTDLRMPKKDGISLLEEIKKFDPSIIVILYTGYGSVDSVIKALRFGAFDYLQKPISLEQLQNIINRTLHRKFLEVQKNLSIYSKLEDTLQKFMYQKQFRNKNRAIYSQVNENEKLDNMIGKSSLMQELFQKVIKISNSDANVMIYGETGTGKELIARSIHMHSERKANAFMPIDCVALPENLLESELFGYEKGAFTGAVSMRRGLLELADQGVLFLDEICELAPHLQAKLLRVLQEREFRRVGGKRLLKVDFRVISATNKVPKQAVKNNVLREDLYYRLNVIPIELPALRERKEDIPLLVEYFIQKFSKDEIKRIDSKSDGCFNELFMARKH